ncbi:unnamed protein product [Cylicocyclus nassatus]|uniref:Solute carrier family 35 member F5 n=1 Tax=Cylicocyclus nassatus TaxID=53992 RepID=A0AA36LZ40_CYLNA|nr:unnamed protein product [Cylicocyclus nassatus]
MPTPSPQSRACLTGRTLGVMILVLVNVLWVLSSEVTRFIFIDENFRRPFFTAYVKTCMLTIYMVRFLVFEKPQQHVYKVLENDASDCESIDLGHHSNLSVEGFETMTSDSENDAERELDVTRSVRFAEHREVRRMPSSEATEAHEARLPYSPPLIDCSLSINLPEHIKHTVFFFAPMWLVCTFTYQTALLFTSVSSLNLISSSSSLFVLVFLICFPTATSRFSLIKALLVAMNLGGVLVVSQFSASLKGAVFAQLSAISYALYITLYTRYQERNGEISINLMFGGRDIEGSVLDHRLESFRRTCISSENVGSIGLLSVVAGTPLLFALDAFDVEKLHPFPDGEQVRSVLLSAVLGTLLGDYLWLTAAGLTDSLSASLSLTLAIPFSFLADTLIRAQPPSMVQLFAAIPITLSFIGAAVLDHRSSPTRASETTRSSDGEDEASLLNEETMQ